MKLINQNIKIKNGLGLPKMEPIVKVLLQNKYIIRTHVFMFLHQRIKIIIISILMV